MAMRFDKNIVIPIARQQVEGKLVIPDNASSVVIFSHGSGSSRLSKRNQQVAVHLQKKNLGTLLFDLLTPGEDSEYRNRFNIDLLTKRLVGATEWLSNFSPAKNCRIGYFGASTGAASALRAATIFPGIGAVVSRGGRPDLAMGSLYNVDAPTLLIVGSLDEDVLRLNKEAYLQLHCKKRLEIVPGATHLFEEEGKMEFVSELAGRWFEKYLLPVQV